MNDDSKQEIPQPIVTSEVGVQMPAAISRIKMLYAHLITNRQADLNGWHKDYVQAIDDMVEVRKALGEESDITAKKVYTKTSFAGEENPWESFARRHLYNKGNGVADRGQSVLSKENFQIFINNVDFRKAFTELIKSPKKETYQAFENAWSEMAKICKTGRNPLLVNRTTGACTLKVSSTASVSKFMTVYGWLLNEGILPKPSKDADWFDKNEQLMSWLCNVFLPGQNDDPASEVWLSIFVWELYKNLANPFSLKKQMVRYGAPGTGKTYTAKRDSQLHWEIWAEKKVFDGSTYNLNACRELVQFHPSYGYEDFIEGLKPVLESGVPVLKLQNGSFKAFCRRAGQWELDVYKIPEVGEKLAEDWSNLMVKQLRPYFSKYLQGNAWAAIEKRQDTEKIADLVPPFFFLIDEINRAELSRVLGELMICLEYRGVGGTITTQYAALNTPETGMLELENGYRFFVPHNVFVIGTMNTIDRSVESFDLALRRRFRWERVDPDIQLLRYHLAELDRESGVSGRSWVKLADDLEKLNQRIHDEDLLGPDYEIGHAYLMNLNYDKSLRHTEVRENVWEDSIRPLLEEYLRGSGRADTLIPEFERKFGL
jgi:5-methylcytosine-specific restriction enzyme B